MLEDIKFSQETTFLGRNGTFKCIGLELSSSGRKTVDIWPTTSKGDTGRARLEVPVADLPTLIHKLQQIYNEAWHGK